MSITYRQNDERPAWEASVEVNGARDDYSAGHTFTVYVAAKEDPETALLTKTSGIFGFAGGVVAVNWEPDDLDLDPGTYDAQLVIKRTVDDFETSVAEDLVIRKRLG